LSPHFLTGLVTGALAFVLDQASKLYLLKVVNLGDTGPIPVAPFAEIRLVWNYGISYGLLRQEGDLGRWLLVGIALAAGGFIIGWLGQAVSRLQAIALGLILGGAVGNAVDRILHGAVVDFVHLHLPDRSLSWYVFNLADAWIVAGVAALLYDMVFSGPTGATKSGSS
jgi:signal peptidase II